MAIGSIDTTTATVSPALVSALNGGNSGGVANTNLPPVDNSQLAAITVVSERSTTSLNGQVTTITTYADGSSRTTVSDGDIVVISSKQQAAA